MLKTFKNGPCFVNSCVYYDGQTHGIYQVLPYAIDFKAFGELWNLLSKTVLSECSFIVRPTCIYFS